MVRTANTSNIPLHLDRYSENWVKNPENQSSNMTHETRAIGTEWVAGGR